MKRVIVAGSPRSNGRSAALAETLFEACIDECPEDELFLVPVSELDIAPCIGCGACAAICPQKIDIPGIMRKLDENVKSRPSWAQLCREREEAARKLKEGK